MKKEDLAKVSGGMYVVTNPGNGAYYNEKMEGYHGPNLLHMNSVERFYLNNLLGLDAVQVNGNISNGEGGYVIKNEEIYVNPQEARDAFYKAMNELGAKVENFETVQR